MVFKSIRFASLLFVLLAGLVTPASAQEPRKQIPVTLTPFDIKTDGTFVVWAVGDVLRPENRFELYAARLANGESWIISSSLGQRTSGVGELTAAYDIDNGIVAFVDDSAGQRRLLATQLETGQTWTVASGALTLPAISGTVVTWWEDVDVARAAQPDRAALPATLKTRDLRTMEPARVVTQTPNTIFRFGPSITTDRWVVWGQSFHNGYVGLEWDIFAVPLGGGAPRKLGDGWGRGSQATVDVQGDQAVYFDLGGGGRPQSGIQPRVVTVDLNSGTRVVSELDAAIEDLATDGHFVFWSKDRSNIRDLWGFDPRTQSAFLVAAGDQSVAWPGSVSVTGELLLSSWSTSDARAVVRVERISEVLPTSRRHLPVTEPGQDYFVETGHTLWGEFKRFWQQSGGLPIFGFPLTEEFIERNADTGQSHTVQYVERQRFELHPDKAGTPYHVLLGRLGAEQLQRAGVDWQSLPKGNPRAPHYYPATGHAIAPEFWSYWRSHGLEFGDRDVSEREALALWGYPVSEPRMETNSSGDTVLTQWFERARFEYHPNNPEPHRVLIGRLAADMLTQRAW